MAIGIFIVILLGLILVHEFGHFSVAKVFGIRVEEFGIGFPPKLFGIKKGETEYTVNALPFGGFVRIFGEDQHSAALSPADANRSFVAQPKLVQVAVLVAGVGMNIITAWILLTVGYGIGLPADSSSYPQYAISDSHVTVITVAPQSPAEGAGILAGEQFVRIQAQTGSFLESDALADDVRHFIAQHGGEALTITLSRGGAERTVVATPAEGLIPEGRALGVVLEDVGILRLPAHLALVEGGKLTLSLTKETVVGLANFFATLVRGNADFASVAGPVGIVGVVDEASQFGTAALIMLAAIISINLAIINLIPFPALDGGRVVMVGVEAITGRPISRSFFAWTSGVGFGLLILLMIVITYHDILRLFA